jgi:hypothetical protein
LDIDVHDLFGVITVESSSIELRGSSVRLPMVYAMATLDGEAWLLSTDAFERWVLIGGKVESTKKRIAWERNKLRRMLSTNGVKNSEKERGQSGCTHLRSCPKIFT